MTGGLPRGARALLRLLPADLREPIAGDVAEEFHLVRTRRGPALAALWAVAYAARLAIVFRWERLMHGRALPPIAEEAPVHISVWSSIRQDAAFGVRLLRRQPGFAFVAVLALALGIGANTAIVSTVDAALWRPLPFAGADAIMSIAEQRPLQGVVHGPVSPADFYDWRRDASSFSDMAAYRDAAMNLTGGDQPMRVRAVRVSPGFLRVLGSGPAIGRDFRDEEDAVGRDDVVLLSDGVWRRVFGADPGIVGRAVQLNGEPYQVVGVLPHSFWWRSAPDLLVPLALSDHDRSLRGAHFLDVIGRLRADVPEERARAELTAIGRRLSLAYPAENAQHGPSLRPLHDALVGDTRTALLVLLGAVALVLLIACANVATLLLARAAGRQKEVAIRRALGAGRGRIIRQFLVESVMLAVAGGVAGVLLADWGLTVFRTLLPARFAELPGMTTIGVDARMLWIASFVSLLTGLAIGVVPALATPDERVGATLAEHSRGGTDHRTTARVRAALVVIELALSLMLLVSAILLLVSFRRLVNVSPGFRPQSVVTATLTLPYARYGDHARVMAFYSRLFDRLRAVPSVQRVAVASAVPFGGGLDARLDLDIENRTSVSNEPRRAQSRLVSDGYFAALGIPLVRGREIDAHDTGSAGDVAVVNQEAVRRYWPDRDPLGQRISLGTPTRWMTIVGVVADIHFGSLDEPAEPEVYIPLAQGFTALGTALERSLTLVVRAAADGPALAPVLRSAVAGVDAEQPIGPVRPMEDLIATSVGPERLNSVLLGAFAGVAVLLTAVGLYGVIAYLVGQRTREFGVRIALGASRRQIIGLVLRQAGAMILAGNGLGLLGALGTTRALGTLLFGVSPTDPVIYASVAGFLSLIALVAVAMPASRATRADPLAALREG